MAEHLITFDWPHNTALRILLTGADTLHRYPNAGLPFTVVNNYGPTECTVLVTSGPVPSKTVDGQLPSIGRPIDDMEILIVDADLRRVTDGTDGEICAAGPQVARGYRNLPDTTAEKFVFEPRDGRRIYRTGDRGRRLPDGQIAFLGRLDDQIKIRGFRVEPDEIVAHLDAHPGIRNSVVVARGENSRDKTLIAYVAPGPGNGIDGFGIARSFALARTRLHDSFGIRESAVLTRHPTGKCDKQSLPEPTPANLLPESRENTSRQPNIQSVSEVPNRSIGQRFDARPRH